MIRLRTALPLLALAIVAGVFATPFQASLLTRAFIWAMLAASVWLLLRIGNRASLGHAAFFGVAAYASGIVVTRWGVQNVWVILLVAFVTSGLAGLIVGSVAARLGGVHFLLLTLAFAEMLRSLATRWREFGGDDGLAGVVVESAWPLPLDLMRPQSRLWLSLALLVVVIGVLAIVTQSPFGATLRAVRDSESRMAALGYNVVGYRIAGFSLSASLAGVAGALNALHTQFVSPAELVPLVSAKALLFVVIGGAPLLGPPLVAVSFVLLEDALSSYTEHWMGVLGVTFVMIAIAGVPDLRRLRPRVVVTGLRRKRASTAARRRVQRAT
jgi:branched-chain amino acid transport system permease protein